MPNCQSHQSGCVVCEQLPQPVSPAGTLYLWSEVPHARAKLVAMARREKWHYCIDPDDCVTIDIDSRGEGNILCALVAGLTRPESEATRALLKPAGAALTPADFARVTSLTQLSALDEAAWLLALLTEGRLHSHYQPIVHVDDPSSVFGHEALARGTDTDGSTVMPHRLFSAARDAGLLFQLDLAARRSAISGARHHQIHERLFVNFTPTAIYDPATCLRSTARAVMEAGLVPEYVIFEVVESEKTADAKHLRAILEQYRADGFKVALDDVGAGYSSLNLIHQLRPDFIKLDMELTRGVHADPFKAMVATKVIEIARELGIATVIEGIEVVEELEWAQAHGADYAQGYLLGRPQRQPVFTIDSSGLPTTAACAD